RLRRRKRRTTIFCRSGKTPTADFRCTRPYRRKPRNNHNNFCKRFLSSLRLHNLSRFAEAIYSEFYDIARLQILRRLHSKAYACGRSRADHIARQQRHELADVGHQKRHGKNHFSGGTALAELHIHFQPHAEPIQAWKLVACRKKWPERSERVSALPFYPLAAALQLKTSFGIIVVQDESCNVFERLGL